MCVVGGSQLPTDRSQGRIVVEVNELGESLQRYTVMLSLVITLTGVFGSLSFLCLRLYVRARREKRTKVRCNT